MIEVVMLIFMVLTGIFKPDSMLKLSAKGFKWWYEKMGFEIAYSKYKYHIKKDESKQQSLF